MRRIFSLFVLVTFASLLYSDNLPSGTDPMGRVVPGVSFISAKFIAADNAVKISWKKVKDFLNYKYRIYRSNTVMDDEIKLRKSNFVSEVDGNTTDFTDSLSSSGDYYYAISVVDLSNREYKLLVKDQSYTSKGLQVRLIPDAALNIRVQYEIGSKKVFLKWDKTENNEVSKFRIYRSKKPITRIKEDFKLKEVNSDVTSYLDTLIEPGKYYYLVTSVSAYGVENNKIMPSVNYTKMPLETFFYTARAPEAEGFGYYTEIEVNKAHPPVFFRFIEELFKERETFSAFDIYDVRTFKKVNKKLINLPVLPDELRQDRGIERVTPREGQTSSLNSASEARTSRLAEEERQSRLIEEIFNEDARAADLERINNSRANAMPQRAREQLRDVQRNTPLTPPSPTRRRYTEEIRPDNNQALRASAAQARAVRIFALKKEAKELKFIVREYYYEKRDYKKVLTLLKTLYSKSGFKSIKHRITYFYARALYDLGKYKRAGKVLLSLKGTLFYKKYRSEIELMIQRAISRL